MQTKGQKYERTINGSIQRSEETEGVYTLSFSSEDPYMRWDGLEILDHTEKAVDLSRIRDIGIALFNHDRNFVLGKVLNPRIENERGVAEIEFDNDEKAAEIKAKVDSGTLKGVSVGYTIDNVERVAQGKKSTCGRFAGPCYIARKWTPLEISIVTVPADATVGVGRSEEDYFKEEGQQVPEEQIKTITATVIPQETIVSEPVPQMDLAAEKAVIVAAERQRVTEITELCREFDIAPDKYIADGDVIGDVRRHVLEELKRNKPPLVQIEHDEQDKYRDAAVDSLLLRAGLPVEKPSEAAQKMRNLGLRGLLNDCLRREGVANPELMTADEIMNQRQFFTPSAAIPAILDQTINKAVVEGYKTYPVTFEEWTVKGSLSDFKPSRSVYTLGSAGGFLRIPEGGEIKHDTLSAYQRPERQLATHGRQFTLTREAIYNDDIGVVTTLPARYAASARKTINKQVYDIIGNNRVIYDGNALFDTTLHKNMATGAQPSVASIKEMKNLLALMVNEENELIYSIPKYLLVPMGMGDVIREILNQQTLILTGSGGTISTQPNPLYGSGLVIVEDPVLNTINANGELEWYLVADKTSIPTIQVDYLNGNESPIIRRMEKPGQLGYIWDIILDWGITVVDYRGIIKNEGQ